MRLYCVTIIHVPPSPIFGRSVDPISNGGLIMPTTLHTIGQIKPKADWSAISVMMMRVGSDTFDDPIFQKGLQN